MGRMASHMVLDLMTGALANKADTCGGHWGRAFFVISKNKYMQRSNYVNMF